MTVFTRVAALAALIFASGLALDPAPVQAFIIDKVAPGATIAAPDLRASIPPATTAVAADPGAEPNVPPPPAALPKPPLPSLAEAVAAQPLDVAPADELRCLATAIYYEAKGEPLLGQLGVAQVIINRTRSGRFATSICGVVKQPHQFSFVRGGRLPLPGARNPAYRTAMSVARVAMTGTHASPAADALYFHAASISPRWSKRQLAAIGHHKFYR